MKLHRMITYDFYNKTTQYPTKTTTKSVSLMKILFNKKHVICFLMMTQKSNPSKQQQQQHNNNNKSSVLDSNHSLLVINGSTVPLGKVEIQFPDSDKYASLGNLPSCLGRLEILLQSKISFFRDWQKIIVGERLVNWLSCASNISSLHSVHNSRKQQQ